MFLPAGLFPPFCKFDICTLIIPGIDEWSSSREEERCYSLKTTSRKRYLLELYLVFWHLPLSSILLICVHYSCAIDFYRNLCNDF